jgi:hypothetical protein
MGADKSTVYSQLPFQHPLASRACGFCRNTPRCQCSDHSEGFSEYRSAQKDRPGFLHAQKNIPRKNHLTKKRYAPPPNENTEELPTRIVSVVTLFA